MALRETFNAFLTRENLIYTYDVALSMPILSLIRAVVHDMESNGFTFAPVEHDETNSILAFSEAQPLRLAGVVNRGRMRGSDAAAHLKASTFDNRRTLHDLMGTGPAFNQLVLMERSRYVIHFCK